MARSPACFRKLGCSRRRSDFASKRTSAASPQYEALWNAAKDDPQGFWGEQAKLLDWSTPWNKVLDWKPPFAKWFVGGKLECVV